MSSQQNNEASKLAAIKDQAVGAVKEAIGNVLGNNKMELEGKAQKIHGKNEYQYAKALKEGETEPQKFQEAYHPQENSEVQESDHLQTAPLADHAQPSAAPVPAPPQQHSTEPSQMSAWKDQAVGAMKENWGEVTNNPQMEMQGKAQNMQGKNEAEFVKAQKEGRNEPQHFEHGTKTTERPEGSVEGDKVSSMSAMKDKTMGSLKENWGSATGNTNTELEGKAQQMHGRNEAEFAKAQKQGMNEPEHYAHGTKETHHAEGKVEGDKPSTLGALKDRAMGSVKETFGSMTGNQNMELKGKAQNMHGRNEAAFAKAQKDGLTEPEHFGQRKPTEAEGEVVSDEPSRMSGWKDQTVGAMKETFGSVTNNQDMELKGKAQSIHGRNETEFAKARSQGLAEPEHFGQGSKTERATERPEGSVEGDKVSSFSAMKDKTMGALKENWGSMTGNTNTELEGKAQQMHGRNEAEFVKAQKQGLNEPEHYAHGTKETHHAEGSVEADKVSSMSAMKDKALGSLKENWGSATGNTNAELMGKAQQMHGRNEAEFAKAQKQGMIEPEHYAHGTKETHHAEGQVEGDKVSSMTAMKDKTMGSLKETWGSATGNTNTELEGKAQQMHGRNEAEFAKAQKQGMNEPEHYARGTKTTEHAQGEVVSEEQPSKMSGWKDQAVGSVKESVGNMMNNEKMELEGKAQKMQGSNACARADAPRNTINA